MPDKSFSKTEQLFLLELSRKVLNFYIKEQKEVIMKPEEVLITKLKNEQGCFVTLHKKEQLRGCIGHILPIQPLYLDVIDNTINAALHDPRFNQVEISELPFIDIEISVLSIPEKLIFNSSEELLNKLKPEKHGVILKKDVYNSTFLPQVWKDLPDKKAFLSQLSLKAGLPPLAWQESGLEVYIYEAFVFSEKDF